MVDRAGAGVWMREIVRPDLFVFPTVCWRFMLVERHCWSEGQRGQLAPSQGIGPSARLYWPSTLRDQPAPVMIGATSSLPSDSIRQIDMHTQL